MRYFYASPLHPSFTVLSPLFSISLSLAGVFLVQRRLCRSTNREIREGNVRDAAAAAYMCISVCVRAYPCSRVLLRPRGECVRERRERARARRGGSVWESARVRVYAAVRA